MSTIPEDKAIDVPADVHIKIRFAEPLAPGAVSQVLRLLIVNPDKPQMVTSVGGHTIEIRATAPLEPRTTYTVLLRPGVPDRRSNLTKEPVEITFSTGGPLTLSLLKGTVSVGDKPSPGANVQAVNRERGLSYRAFADSSGAFQLTSVALGTYDVTAWIEGNGTEGFQFTLEAGDTASAAIEKSGAGADVQLTLVVSDTSAARLARVEPIARDGLELSFSDTLARDSKVDLAKVLVLRLSPEAAPRGTPLDSIPQTAVIGDTLPIIEVRRDTLQPKAVVLHMAANLADSTAYAVRVGGVVNTVGLVAPDEPPFVLFRTRVLPDSTLATQPDSAGGPGAKPAGPAGARTPGALPTGPAPPGAARPQAGQPRGAPPQVPPADTTGAEADTSGARSDTTAARADTAAAAAPRDTSAPTDTTAATDTTAPAHTTAPVDTTAPIDATSQ